MGHRRIKGAAVADASYAVAAPQSTDTVMGGEACGLVDHHKAKGGAMPSGLRGWVLDAIEAADR